RARREQSGSGVEKGGFPAAGRPDDGDELARADGQPGRRDGRIGLAAADGERDGHILETDGRLAKADLGLRSGLTLRQWALSLKAARDCEAGRFSRSA